jgi:hypothetical protein
MDLDNKTVLKVPPANIGQLELEFDMRPIYELEARQREIANVSKVTAPELMQAFIDGYGHASRYAGKLELELKRTESLMEERKAIVYLDEAPRILREKRVVRESNPGGSEDQRKAVLALDVNYMALRDNHDHIEAAVELMRTKMKLFEMSYQSVKKVYDSLSGSNALDGAGSRSGGYPTGGKTDYGSFTVDHGEVQIGKPRY